MTKQQKVFILTYLCVLFFGSFLLAGITWYNYGEIYSERIHGLNYFLYYFFAGAIGGSLYHLYHFCTRFMANKLTDPREWIMYVFYPIFATGTAVMTITLINSGLLAIDFTKNPNSVYAQISISFIVGFGFKKFIKKLDSIVKQRFSSNNTPSSTD
ncbi:MULTISPECIES: hypothetical protein [unclassified Bacillus (in: firmicutes)]|uniref:hypothetical protein n=1 Tax=unclassified Bacillus (in: firmicutes) TaxID=185979 RepID=UPI000BEFE17D|nr:MULTISPECIES: hypothetical protein [unclassified Bacillus (in: firmicutes)]PEJ46693.1 hypothetical protein CN692_25675 [Bacillus sp. AFS002410]PEL07680.1 hypothetical protein CN601_19750 [Bacillus sp. AFS017336]